MKLLKGLILVMGGALLAGWLIRHRRTAEGEPIFFRRSARKPRHQELADEVYSLVFCLLDKEPELDGMECGRIATRVEALFLQELEQ